jgi:hypothetical protein
MTNSLLMGVLIPALRKAGDAGRRTLCLSNLRSLTQAWSMHFDISAVAQYAVGNVFACLLRPFQLKLMLFVAIGSLCRKRI